MALAKELLLDGDISLKDKYLSFDKEKRIRRMQFFERMLIPGLLLALFLFIPSYIVGLILSPENSLKWGFYLNIVFQFIYFFVIFKFYPVVIKKRAQDFGKEGKIETIVLLGGSLINGLFSLYVQYLASNMDFAGMMSVSMKFGTLNSILGGILTILWLYLLFRPGTKGKNDYGEQKYYKLKFLG